MYGKGPGYGAPSGYDPRFQNQFPNMMPPPQMHNLPMNFPPVPPYHHNFPRFPDQRFQGPNFGNFYNQPPPFLRPERGFCSPALPRLGCAMPMERARYNCPTESNSVFIGPPRPSYLQDGPRCPIEYKPHEAAIPFHHDDLLRPPQSNAFHPGTSGRASSLPDFSGNSSSLRNGPIKVPSENDGKISRTKRHDTQASDGCTRGRGKYFNRQSSFSGSSPNRKSRDSEGKRNEERAGDHRKRNHSLDNSNNSKRQRCDQDDAEAFEEADFKKRSSDQGTYKALDDKRIEEEAKELEMLLENYEEERIADWVRCSPADLYFKRNPQTGTVESTKRMQDLERRFEFELLSRASRIRSQKSPVVIPERYHRKYKNKPPKKNIEKEKDSDDEDSDEESQESESSEEEGENGDESETSSKLDIITWKNQHPEKLHDEMWFNLYGEMNDGPLCRCSTKTKSHGIRHNIYPGEQNIKKCESHSCNSNNLFHYKITMSPHTNFLTKNPTLIFHDGHEYIFEGFSLFSHYKLSKVPTCKVIRFNIEYTIHWFEEDIVENFDVKSLDLFSDFLYGEVLELLDLDWIRKDCESSCRCFHLMPRFSRGLPDNGKEILSMNEVLKFMLESNKPLIDEMQLGQMLHMTDHQWQDFVDEVRGMIVSFPGKRPSSLRIDQLDRAQNNDSVIQYPVIIHFGYRPAQLSYVGDAVYSKLFKQYMKLKYLVANKPKLTLKDKEKLRQLEEQLQEIRLKGSLKREMTVEISSEGFVRTGLKSDICQHALLLPVLLQHLRFHKCLEVLEENIGYQFKDRLYLQMAMTHPSFRMNYGTNPDHARNSLSNCGMRQLEYGNRHIHYMHTRKRGIKTLMHIMSKMARAHATASEIHHYERLEFLGDTVIEFLSSIHLFFLFPRLEEGGLATYRAALVQNQHLTVLAQKLGLQHFLLYAHGPDLCRDLDLRYALANCFEALLGSLFLDGGIEVADKIFGEALFKDEAHLLGVWRNLPSHPLQEDEPLGDRHWISKSKPLQKLVTFEEETGFQFNHVRLLARAFTMRNIGFNNLTLGHNQTLEFLGDTILQFITSEYLFKHFPDHHEGHLTLLRSSLVNNKTQAIICDDLGMTEYVINNDPKVKERMENEKNKVKDKADILEAFIGSLYVDQGLDPCVVFCQVCFYPRLKEFIMNQDWNDAKSQLQQCCLTLRDPTDGEPDIPVYKVLQCTGPTNTRKYHVAVYFRGDRLATGVGHSIQQGEMNAATNALKEKSDMFPHLLQTKQYLDWRFGRGGTSRSHSKPQSKEDDVERHSSKRYSDSVDLHSKKHRKESQSRSSLNESKYSRTRPPINDLKRAMQSSRQ